MSGEQGFMKTEIPAEAERILQMLNERGYEAYIVGGCVRDMILGRQPEDWDITTNALPAQVKSVFRRTVDTGIQHGTVTVMMKGHGYEVTTYRIDGEYSDGRHPDRVAFTPSLAEDLKRRDFTINAMAYNRTTGLVDLFAGREDLKRGIIRCVGNPMERFGEDALRILRAIRFSAQLGFSIEEETGQAIQALAPSLAKVSRERVQAELTKLLLSSSPEKIRLVYDMGAAPYVSQAFCRAGSGECPIPAAIPAKKHLRWAAFLRTAGPETASKVLKDLKMDNDTTNRVRVLTGHLGKAMVPEEARGRQDEEKMALRRLMCEVGGDLFDDLLVLKECLAPETENREYLQYLRELAEEIKKAGDCTSLKDLAVTGNDVMQAGVAPGRDVGRTLNRLLELVLEEPSRNEKSWLLNHIFDCSSMKKEL